MFDDEDKSVKFWRDKSGSIEKYADAWRAKDKTFSHLKDVNILFAFRSKHETDRDGFAIAAKAKKLSNRDRDLFGFDFAMLVAHNIWRELSKRQRARLVWHELLHFQLQYDEDGMVKKDKQGRIKLALLRHDLVIRSFRAEVEKFGLSADELDVSKFLAKQYLKRKRERSK